MVDREVVEAASGLLSTAAAELFEDHHDAAVTVGKTGMASIQRATMLIALGQDLTALGQAIDVLVRRSEDHP